MAAASRAEAHWALESCWGLAKDWGTNNCLVGSIRPTRQVNVRGTCTSKAIDWSVATFTSWLARPG
eukprot:9638297-Alexandrium_andersonii.AAC.1